MSAYYNENDPHAAHVLRHLVSAGLIAPGDVDERSITEVQPDDLRGYSQGHFFAGAGLWSVAARLAGWDDERPLWTGSCPCQPFSAAGRRQGTDDARHLWPHFFRLIRACRPRFVMGEQVAGPAGYGWFDGVAADLEAEDYACRAVDIPACAMDAPHIRSRLYWCAVGHHRPEGRLQPQGSLAEVGGRHRDTDAGGIWAMVDATRLRWGKGRAAAQRDVADGLGPRRTLGPLATDKPGALWQQGAPAVPHDAGSGGGNPGHNLALAESGGREGRHPQGRGPGAADPPAHQHGASAWADYEWLRCHDGKARRTEPGLRLLVDGMAGRISAWRLGGNSISPVLAAQAIAALIDCNIP